jgi:hypothetical protein
MLVWTEGTGWKKGGSLAWQLYDSEGNPAGEKGAEQGMPVWSFAAVVSARALGHWSYTSLMPTLSVLGVTVGIVPIAQITLLPALSLRLATWPERFR